MTDHIRVRRIAVFAHHGLLPEEARLGQRFYLSLDCTLDLAEAGRSDDMAASVSYADLTEIAVSLATGRRFALIEALAEAVASEILDRFWRIQSVTVEVDKPGAPVPHVIESVSVAVTRTRDGRP